VLGLLGADAQETQAMAQKLGVPRAYQSLAQLLADPEVNVVHLCTPNYLHFPQAKAALLAGKHVLCEKPLATTRAEAEELVRLAREQHRAAAVNYNLRFYPLCQEARARSGTWVNLA
jgi:predicted dehydrogenase